MSIHLPAAPPEAADALRNYLSSLPTAPVGLSPLFPGYSAGAQDVLDERVLGAARLTAWQTIVSKEGEAIATATVGSDMGLPQVHEGALVAGMVEAVRQAEERFSSDNRDYELRLLRIPALYTVALWLHAGDADVMVPVAPAPRALRANDSYGPDAFTAALRPLAEAALREPDIT
jgi:hypothetical protein